MTSSQVVTIQNLLVTVSILYSLRDDLEPSVMFSFSGYVRSTFEL